MDALQSLKKANKDYKLKLAIKNGFESVKDYMNFLEGKNVVTVKVKTRVTKTKPTVHVVDILDASGSMDGGKYNNSKEGILQGIKDLVKEGSINYTYSLTEFVDSRRIIEHCFMSDLKTNPSFFGAKGGDTPLYKTVFDVLNKLKSRVNMVDKVLVKVYTDGLNNSEYGYTLSAARLIKELQEQNFTITFVATDRDLEGITRDLSLDRSNTLAVENSAEGFKKAFKMSSAATSTYMSMVAEGKDVSRGFYKKTGKL